MPAWICRGGVAFAQLPRALVPGMIAVCSDLGDELLIFEAFESACQLDRTFRVVANKNARPLNTAFAQNTSKLARINAGDCHNTLLFKVIRQRLVGTKVGYVMRTITNNNSCDLCVVRFDIFGVNARATDMRIGKRDDLAVVAGISQNFLVSRHCGIEQNFSHSMAACTDRNTLENSTISQSEYCYRRTLGSPRKKRWLHAETPIYNVNN